MEKTKVYLKVFLFLFLVLTSKTNLFAMMPPSSTSYSSAEERSSYDFDRHSAQIEIMDVEEKNKQYKKSYSPDIPKNKFIVFCELEHNYQQRQKIEKTKEKRKKFIEEMQVWIKITENWNNDILVFQMDNPNNKKNKDGLEKYKEYKEEEEVKTPYIQSTPQTPKQIKEPDLAAIIDNENIKNLTFGKPRRSSAIGIHDQLSQNLLKELLQSRKKTHTTSPKKEAKAEFFIFEMDK